MPKQATLQSWIARQWQTRGAWSWLMRPLAVLYGWLARRRRHAYATGRQSVYRAPVPVIVIGNIYVGGTGKTPLACALGDLLMRQGWHPGLVSRGYGRQYGRKASALPAIGQGQDLDWRLFGDEPTLIARKTGMPISVHRDRGMAAQALLRAFPHIDIILSDDGLQHYRLARDFEILVQDERGVGNGLLLPAGPLREPPARQQAVDLVLHRQRHALVGTQLAFDVQIDSFWQPATGIKTGADGFTSSIGLSHPVAAVAGIGVPERFFKSLAEMGISVEQTYPLADHAAIDTDWLMRLPAKTILITEKDAVKLTYPITDTRIWVTNTSVCWWHQGAQAALIQRLAAAGIRRLEP